MNLLQQILVILTVFYGTAYISFSAKETGLFAYLAEKTFIRKWRGRALSFVVFIVSGLLCFLTDNDVVILTLTPMLLHLHGKHDIRKLLLIQFAAANTFSLFSLVSNPTNVIIASRFGIDYLGFVELMWPIGILSATAVLILVPKFRSTITLTVAQKTPLNIPLLFSGAGVLSLLVLLATGRFTQIDIWLAVTAVLAIFLTRDLILGKIPAVVQQLPLRAGVVIISGFAVVGLLSYTDITNSIASMLSELTFVNAAIAVTVASTLLAAVIINIPMAILMSSILFLTSFPAHEQVALVGLVFMSSDIATLIFRRASLAGHMWQHMIEKDDGKGITSGHFTRSLAPAGIVASIIGLCVVILGN